MPCLCWLIRWHTSPNSCDDKNRTPGTAVLVAEHDMLGSGVHCSMSCISLPGEVHDTLGGRQGLMSTTQGCASLHCCSESVHTHYACAGWQTGLLVRWPVGRDHILAGCGGLLPRRRPDGNSFYNIGYA